MTGKKDAQYTGLRVSRKQKRNRVKTPVQDYLDHMDVMLSVYVDKFEHQLLQRLKEVKKTPGYQRTDEYKFIRGSLWDIHEDRKLIQELRVKCPLQRVPEPKDGVVQLAVVKADTSKGETNGKTY
jgi:hypothetical protein